MKTSIAKFLYSIGISANFLTGLGLFIAVFSGWLIFKGQFFWAGIALVLSGLIDLMDGAVARVSGKDSVFGGILDSSLDRYGDGFVFGGLILYAANELHVLLLVAALIACLGSFEISYIRARAECEMDSCRVGFWERGERIGVLAIGLLSGHLTTAVLFLAVGTHWTAFQRLMLSFWNIKIQRHPNLSRPFFLIPRGRMQPIYYVKLLVILGGILCLNIP